MSYLHKILLSCTLAGLSTVHAQTVVALPQATAATHAPTHPPALVPPADVPAPKTWSNGSPDPGFLKRHETYVAIAKRNKTGVLFIGDSITDFWGTKEGRDIWANKFGSYSPANFGISGDKTQHVLWRVTNGELDGFEPKAIVLLIGTNNLTGIGTTVRGPNMGGYKAEDIASGIARIVEIIRQKVPNGKILLCAIFPRGEKPGPLRDKIKDINARIAKLDDGKSVFYLDFGDKFLEPDGTISKDTFHDFLHPSKKGYEIWADAITPKLAELVR